MNYGLIEEKPSLSDLSYGIGEKHILSESRDFTNFLVKKEYQRDYKNNYDVSGCVTFSMLNCFETLLLRNYGLSVNFSDRYTVVASGTKPSIGNSISKVFDTIKRLGVVEEEWYPFESETLDEYYKKIPEHITRRGELIKNSYDFQIQWIGWEGVSNEALYDYLQYGPIQVTLRAWGATNAKGIYDYVRKDTNHAVMLYKMDEKGNKWIYDHYEKSIKQLSPEFYIKSAAQFYVSIRTLSPFHFAALFYSKHNKLPKYKDYRLYIETGVLSI